MDSVDRPIRLLLAIPHLGGGGAERVMALLAEHLDPQLFEIHLVLFTPDRPGAPTLPPHVTTHRLHVRRVRHATLPLLRLIRNLKPRLILSGAAHLNFLILSLKLFLPYRTRLLIRQSTTASAVAESWLTRLAYRYLYPHADRILCQSQAMAADLAEHFGLAQQKLHILHNPIATPAATPFAAPLSSGAAATSLPPQLLFVGRLNPQKGADLLLHAFAELRKLHATATLTLLGAGEEEWSLRQLAHSLDIAAAIHFAGHADPAPYFREATLFVLPSRLEGMPNALLEAAAAGLPIVATPASAGLVDLLRDAPGCWIASRITASALAATLNVALDALPSLPRRLSHAFLAPFRLEPAITAYSELLFAESRPTVAFLIPTLDQIGGAERQVLDLVQELTRRGWPVHVITLSGTGRTIPSGIPHLSLKMRKAWIDPAGWLRYLRWHAQTRPEILHAHLPHASFFARLSRLVAPAPVLIDTIHTTAAGPLSRRLTYRLTDFLTDRLTCVSRAVQQSILSAHIAPNPMLVPNGIRIPELTTPELTIPRISACSIPSSSAKIPFRWLAIGRLARVKDYPTLLRAFSHLPAHAILVIAGSGPDASALEALASELGIASRVQFLGFQANVQPHLAEADAFVQSSLWEGLPISILEASAAALPIVATDAAGTREALIPGQTGFLVPVAEIESLAAVMRELMNTPPYIRRQIGLQGRSFVQSNFSMAGVADQWEQIYLDLLDEAVQHKAHRPTSAKPHLA